MDRLPQEIIDHIISYVGIWIGSKYAIKWRRPRQKLPLARPPIAAISRRFQAAVEELTFRMLVIESTEIADLERMFDRYPARGQALKSLTIGLVLPRAGPSQQQEEDEEDKFANDDDRAANNSAVTTELENLFNLLAKWCGDIPCVDLEMDVCFSPLAEADQSSRTSSRTRSEPKYRFSLLNLVNQGNSLPHLPCVKRFAIFHGSTTWHPSAVTALTSRMTHAEQIEWQLGWIDTELWGGYHAMDLQWREALMRAVLESSNDGPIVASSVTDFICVIMSSQSRENESLPDMLRASEEPEDLMGRAMQRLSRGCEKLEYWGPVHASFFDCCAQQQRKAAGEEAWDKLRELNIKFDHWGPHGKWYFGFGDGDPDPSDEPLAEISSQMPPGYGATEQELEDALAYYEDNYVGQDQDNEGGDGLVRRPRKTAVDAELNPLLANFVRACARLPSLEMASLKAGYEETDDWHLVLIVAAPGKTVAHRNWDKRFARGAGTWRVYLYVKGGWRPDRETMEVFENLGRDAARRTGTDETVVAFPGFLPRRTL